MFRFLTAVLCRLGKHAYEWGPMPGDAWRWLSVRPVRRRAGGVAMNRLLLIVLLLLLAGCGPKQVKPSIPEKVYVRVEVPAELPASLTAPCPPVRAEGRKVEAVVSAYNTNVPVQDDCDRRMGEIRRLTKPVPEQVGR